MKPLRCLIFIAAVAAAGCGSDSSPPVFPAPTNDTGSTTGGATDVGQPPKDTKAPPQDNGKPPTPDVQQNDEQFCPPGYAFCNGNTLFTCTTDGAKYDTQVCQQGCASGACKTSCTNGQTACLDTKTLGVCQPDGTYKTQTCTQGLCKDGKCTNEQTLCKPNEILCDPVADSKKLVQCSPDGVSVKDFQICPFGCDKTKNVCNDQVCQNGEKRCALDAPNWVEECQNAQQWVKVTGCPFKCKDGACVTPTCEPGDQICGDKGIMLCADDQLSYKNIEDCKLGCMINPAGGYPACIKCKAGTKGCDVYTITKCEDPLVGYVNDISCPYPDTCAAGECIDVLELDKTDAPEDNYLVVMKEFVACMQFGNDGVCKGLNTTAIGYPITVDKLKDWLCGNDSLESSFVGDEWSKANDLLGCDTFDLTDISMFTGAINPGLDGVECFAFSSGGGTFSNAKEIIVDVCSNFSKQAGN